MAPVPHRAPHHPGSRESIPKKRGTWESNLAGTVPRGPQRASPRRGGPGSPTSQVLSPATLAMGRQHSRYWQRSPMKVGRQRQLGWLPWLTVQLPLFRQ